MFCDRTYSIHLQSQRRGGQPITRVLSACSVQGEIITTLSVQSSVTYHKRAVEWARTTKQL
jgi:hypothetical protein